MSRNGEGRWKHGGVSILRCWQAARWWRCPGAALQRENHRGGSSALGSQAAAPGQDATRAVGLQNSRSAALGVSHTALHTENKLTGIRRRSCGSLQHTLSTWLSYGQKKRFQTRISHPPEKSMGTKLGLKGGEWPQLNAAACSSRHPGWGCQVCILISWNVVNQCQTTTK